MLTPPSKKPAKDTLQVEKLLGSSTGDEKKKMNIFFILIYHFSTYPEPYLGTEGEDKSHKKEKRRMQEYGTHKRD